MHLTYKHPRRRDTLLPSECVVVGRLCTGHLRRIPEDRYLEHIPAFGTSVCGRCPLLVSARNQLDKGGDRKQAIHERDMPNANAEARRTVPKVRVLLTVTQLQRALGANKRMRSRVLDPIKYTDKHLFRS